MAGRTRQKSKGNAVGKSPAKGGKLVPALCNVIGMVLLVGVIALCLPLTVPRIMGYEVYDVVSGSMEPAIPVGSAVLVKPTDAAQLQEGDVVAYYAVSGSNVREGGAVMDGAQGAGGGNTASPNSQAGEGTDSADATEDDSSGSVGVADEGEASIVVHRVVTNRTLMGELVTKGDANNVEDFNPIPYDNVIGRVETSIPMVGTFMSIYASTAGKVYLLLTAACGVMLNMLAGRMRSARRERVEQIAEAAAEVGLTPEAAEKMLYGGASAGAASAGSAAVGAVGAGSGQALHGAGSDDAGIADAVTAEAARVGSGYVAVGDADASIRPEGAQGVMLASSDAGNGAGVGGGARHAAPAGAGSVPSQSRLDAGASQGGGSGKSGGSRKDASKKRGGSKLRVALAVVLAVVFLGSAGVVGYVNWQYHISDALYHDAADRFTSDGDGSGEIAPKKVDFKALQAENPDIVGWIYCKDTVIDYPVLKGKDNDQYLYHDYTGAYNIDGSIFVDAENRDDFVDSNTIVYGHHMNSGSMFAGLIKWADQEYYDKHKVVWLLTPEQDYKIELFAGHHVDAHSEAYQIAQTPSVHLYSLLSKALADSDFKADVAPTQQLLDAVPKAKQWALDNAKSEDAVQQALVIEPLENDKKPHVPSASKLGELANSMKDFPPANPDAAIQLGTDDRYIMLSTCAYLFDNDRYVLNGKLIPVASAGGKKKKN